MKFKVDYTTQDSQYNYTGIFQNVIIDCETDESIEDAIKLMHPDAVHIYVEDAAEILEEIKETPKLNWITDFEALPNEEVIVLKENWKLSISKAASFIGLRVGIIAYVKASDLISDFKKSQH